MRASIKIFSLLLVAITSCAFSSPRDEDPALRVEDALSVLTFMPLTPIAVSADGKWVAYTTQDPRRLESPKESRYRFFTATGIPTAWSATDVWVTNTHTGESKNLTHASGSAWGPAWSPDGKALAFYSDRSGAARLWVWTPDSGDLRQLSEAVVRAWYGNQTPMWTHDGKKILVKMLPEALTIEMAADLIVGTAAARESSNKTAGPSVHVLSFDPSVKPQLPSNDPVDSTTNNVDLADLALVDVATGAVDRIASGYRPAGYWVSPTGNEIAFTSLKGIKAENSQQSVFDIMLIELPEKRARVVAPAVFMSDGMSASWSPDGRWLSYTTSEARYNLSREHEPGECFLVPAGGGTPRKLTKGPHPDFGRFFRGPVWAADSQSLYLLGGDALWKVTVKDAAAQEIAKDEQRKLIEIVSAEVSTGFWSTDSGRSMVVRTRSRDTRQAGFFRVDLENGKLKKLLEEDKDYGLDASATYELDVSGDGKVVVYRSEDAQHSADLWIAGPNFQNPRRLTHINPQFDRYSFGKSRMIDYRSGDGSSLHSALLLPSDYQEGKRYPLVVHIYGDSMGSDNVNLFGLASNHLDNMQLLATRGYAVLYPDVPLHLGTPMADIAKTVIPAVNKVIDLGIADPDRIGVMGYSYGGYSALALVVQTRLFRAAIDGAGPGDLFARYSAMGPSGSAPGIGWAEEGQGRMGGTPWQFRDRYIENSPIFYLDRVETPLLIIQAGLDRAVPSYLSDQVFVGMRRLGKKVVYVNYEGEDHSAILWSYANQTDYCNRIIAWFDQEMSPRVTSKTGN